MLSNGSVLDLTTVSAGAALPRSMMACIRGGAPTQDATRNAIQDAETQIRGGQQVAGVYRQNQVTFLPPITPGKIMAIGRNYAAHVAEAGNAAAPTKPGRLHQTGKLPHRTQPDRVPPALGRKVGL